ncbi:MAG TPA: Flp pilus assembly protein CpaB [Stellaceae bacterium]|nr:Flp pilus assembly protein CpaB [Stellaceae bacterium]
MFTTIPPRRLMLLAAAMGLSLITALIVRGWVENSRQDAAPAVVEAPKVGTMVLVAAKPLPAGHFIKDEDLKWQSWPDDNLSSTYLLQSAINTDAIVGSVARAGIAAGEPITDDRIVKKGDRGFLAAIVTPGYRAITVTMTSNAGLSGLAIPGDRVDVLLTVTAPSQVKDQPDRKFTETVMQDIRVLAVDQKINDQSDDSVMARTATLEVTPKQAEMVTLMQELGKMSMTLRSVGSAENDAQPHKPTLTSDNEAMSVLGMNRGGPSNGIDVVRGTERTTIYVSGHTVHSVQEDTPAPAPVGAADKKALQSAQPGQKQ